MKKTIKFEVVAEICCKEDKEILEKRLIEKFSKALRDVRMKSYSSFTGFTSGYIETQKVRQLK